MKYAFIYAYNAFCYVNFACIVMIIGVSWCFLITMAFRLVTSSRMHSWSRLERLYSIISGWKNHMAKMVSRYNVCHTLLASRIPLASRYNKNTIG